MILLIDNYDSFTFNLVHYLGDLGAECDVRRNDALSVTEALALRPEAIVLSPGPCSPNEAGICCDLIAAAAGQVPLLGVCLGHQALGAGVRRRGGARARADAWQGEPGPAPRQRHLRRPSEPVEATRYHSLVVRPETLPDTPGADRLD